MRSLFDFNVIDTAVLIYKAHGGVVKRINKIIEFGFIYSKQTIFCDYFIFVLRYVTNLHFLMGSDSHATSKQRKNSSARKIK